MMSNEKQDKNEHPSPDRRDFLRRFFKRGAPLVAGAVASPLSKLVPEDPEEVETAAIQRRAAKQAEAIAEDLKKEFEKTHEEFIKNNPDFFDKA
jgi:hypothetical protein